MIKNYKEFIKESQARYEYGCVMVDYNFENWSELLNSIEQDDIYKVEGKNYGLQPRPHLTLLYGVHKEVEDEDIQKCFEGMTEDDFKVQIEGVSLFENPEFDVVKLGVTKTDKLQEVYDRLSQLPNSNQFPEYKPHITIGYVKKGLGQKYLNPDYKYQIKNISKIVYVRPDKSEYNISL
jgi:2'-5' RNA ligase